MSDTPSSQPSRAADDPALATLLEDQQSRWQRGERLPVEAYLQRHPALTGDREAVLELILHEVLLRLERGETPALGEYQQRFPHLAEPLALQFEVENALASPALASAPPATVHDLPPPAAAGDSEEMPERLGRYHIVGRLGAGGMGVVYRAHDPELRRDVAIKAPCFRGPAATQAEARRRFLREARAAAAVRHPNVCPIHDVGEDGRRPYVVMALVEGQSLGDQLQRHGRFERPTEAAALVAVIADALAAVHAAGIVHRDVKPGNILLDRAGTPLLSDFGLARDADSEHLTEAGTLLGTPAYMAPEQAAGELGAVGPWSDQYSLGVVLYHLLTGRTPFEGTPLSVLYQIGTTAPPPPSRFRPDLDPGLEAICLKALAKQPALRYGSLQELAVVLRRYSQGDLATSAGEGEAGAQANAGPAPVRKPGRSKRRGGKQKRQRSPQDAEAHALYLKGRHHWNKRTEDGLRKSIAFFYQALDREPACAPAWTGLADAYHQLGHWGLAPPGTAYPRGKSAALKAIELDESLTEAHLALAVILKDYDWDFAGAERAFQRALRQTPENASGHQWYGQCLACMGRHEEAIAELRRAGELDPLSLINDAVLGRHGYFFARRYDQAREQLRRAVLTDPHFWIAQKFLGWVYLFQGDSASALAAFDKARALDDNPETLVALGYGHAVAGDPSRARQCLAALTELAPHRYLAPVNLALVHAALGEMDQAFTWLAKACEDHSQWLSEVRVDPAFDPLRSDPRFDTLLRRMNITL
jgi:serine/threonine-protein kinase